MTPSPPAGPTLPAADFNASFSSPRPSGPEFGFSPLHRPTPQPMRSSLFIFALALISASVLRDAEANRTVSLVLDPAPGRAAQHGIDTLRDALRTQGWTVDTATSLASAQGQRLVIAGGSASHGPSARTLSDTGASLPFAAEAL